MFFFNLNITDYIVYHMKKEILGSVIFVTFVFGVNYILTHVLNEYNKEDSQEEEIQMEDTLDDTLDDTQDDKPDDIQDDTQDDKPDDIQDDTQDDKPDDIPDDTIKILDSVKNVIENEIKDDILTIQKILERKKYLLNLNNRLSDIKLKLQELQTELSRS